MTDILEWLRDLARDDDESPLHDAADEIERLRERIKFLEAALCTLKQHASN